LMFLDWATASFLWLWARYLWFFCFRNELHMQGPRTTINVVLLRCLTLCLWEGARLCMLVLLVCDLGPHRIILARFWTMAVSDVGVVIPSER
jgi:hypothetical protein